jgi:hypothetical protein
MTIKNVPSQSADDNLEYYTNVIENAIKKHIDGGPYEGFSVHLKVGEGAAISLNETSLKVLTDMYRKYKNQLYTPNKAMCTHGKNPLIGIDTDTPSAINLNTLLKNETDKLYKNYVSEFLEKNTQENVYLYFDHHTPAGQSPFATIFLSTHPNAEGGQYKKLASDPIPKNVSQEFIHTFIYSSFADKPLLNPKLVYTWNTNKKVEKTPHNSHVTQHHAEKTISQKSKGAHL